MNYWKGAVAVGVLWGSIGMMILDLRSFVLGCVVAAFIALSVGVFVACAKE